MCRKVVKGTNKRVLKILETYVKAFSDICEKPEGSKRPSGPARVRETILPIVFLSKGDKRVNYI